MCESLRGKRIKRFPDLSVPCLNLGMCYMHKDVKSAVEFYKKYRVSTEHIKENYQLGGVYNIDLWDDYPELIKQYLKQDKSYNDWLFDYCFGDVI